MILALLAGNLRMSVDCDMGDVDSMMDSLLTMCHAHRHEQSGCSNAWVLMIHASTV